MRLTDYLKARGESENGFARRCGVSQSHINQIVREVSGLTLDLARLIVEASEEQPAPGGATIGYEDLVSSTEATA